MSPSPRQHSSRTRNWVECCLWASGVVCLGYYGYVWTSAKIAQMEGNRDLERILSAPAQTHAVPNPAKLVGRLEIPRIGLTAVVFEGDGSETLQLGIGHLPGSALPGPTGNVVLAAHRDTFFRPLEGIRTPDVIKLATGTGIHTYVVESATVVNPEQTSVLAPTKDPTLTLVTCYPFYYIGPAPQRFIVRAREVPEDQPRAAAGSSWAPRFAEATLKKPPARRPALPKPSPLLITQPPSPLLITQPPSPLLITQPNDDPLGSGPPGPPAPVERPKSHWYKPSRIAGKIGQLVRLRAANGRE